MAADVQSKFMVNIDALKEQWSTLNAQQIKEELEHVLIQAYEIKETQVTPEIMRRMERMILLHVIDTKWKEHLYSMDQVKDGISLRALGQRDPLVEYKKEGFSMFKTMYASINHEVAAMIFRLQAMPQELRPRSVFSAIPQKAVHQEFQGGIPKACRPSASGVGGNQMSTINSRAAAPVRTGIKSAATIPVPAGPVKNTKNAAGRKAMVWYFYPVYYPRGF